MVVTELGRYVIRGSRRSHVVKLVHENGTDVSNGAVTVNTSGVSAKTYAYSTLPVPITLAASSTYFLVSQELVGGDFWYDYRRNTISLSGGAKATGAVWANEGSASFVVPNAKAPETYGPVNLKYK